MLRQDCGPGGPVVESRVDEHFKNKNHSERRLTQILSLRITCNSKSYRFDVCASIFVNPSNQAPPSFFSLNNEPIARPPPIVREYEKKDGGAQGGYLIVGYLITGGGETSMNPLLPI